MVIRAVSNILVVCALLGWIAAISSAQETQERKAAATTSSPPSGEELYKQHCAVCHGNNLKGNGPFPSPYRVPPDLTTLARRHVGKFPEAYVEKVLRNGVTLPAHGPAEMPVWGAKFAVTNRLDTAQVAARIKNLTNYIKSLQAK